MFRLMMITMGLSLGFSAVARPITISEFPPTAEEVYGNTFRAAELPIIQTKGQFPVAPVVCIFDKSREQKLWGKVYILDRDSSRQFINHSVGGDASMTAMPVNWSSESYYPQMGSYKSSYNGNIYRSERLSPKNKLTVFEITTDPTFTTVTRIVVTDYSSAVEDENQIVEQFICGVDLST